MTEPSEATLYVWGRREITPTWETPLAPGTVSSLQMALGGGLPTESGTDVDETAWEPPEDQTAALALVRRIATQRSVPLRVVDLESGATWCFAKGP